MEHMSNHLLGKRSGIYLTCLYLFVKVLYVVNAVGQMFLINYFLGSPSTYNGWLGGKLWYDYFSDSGWYHSGIFPRVAYCDFQVRDIGQPRTHTIQCVLQINMFTEKVYMLVWLICAIMAVFTLLDLVGWIWLSWMPQSRYRFVDKYLRLGRRLALLRPDSPLSAARKKAQEAGVGDSDYDFPADYVPFSKVITFVDKTVRHDGVFIMRLVAANASFRLVSELLEAIYEKHLQNEDEDEE